MTTRIDRRMAKLKSEGRPALVTYIMGGDPDYDTSLSIMKALPISGSDIIELGMPFSDPMADGPAIQAAGQRALKGGQTLARTLKMASEFRAGDDETCRDRNGQRWQRVSDFQRAHARAPAASSAPSRLACDAAPPRVSSSCLPRRK